MQRMYVCILLWSWYVVIRNQLAFFLNMLYSIRKACQKEDWKTHKTLCNSLKDGTWSILEFTAERRTAPGEYWVDTSDSEMRFQELDPDGNVAPPNIHGDRTFLIKIQRPITNQPGDSFYTPMPTDSNPYDLAMKALLPVFHVILSYLRTTS